MSESGDADDAEVGDIGVFADFSGEGSLAMVTAGLRAGDDALLGAASSAMVTVGGRCTDGAAVG